MDSELKRLREKVTAAWAALHEAENDLADYNWALYYKAQGLLLEPTSTETP